MEIHWSIQTLSRCAFVPCDPIHQIHLTLQGEASQQRPAVDVGFSGLGDIATGVWAVNDQFHRTAADGPSGNTFTAV